MMNLVNTTLSPISVDQLGKVNIHEHIILDGAGNPNIPTDFHHVDTQKMAAELTAWKQSGGGVIVDSSPIGAGRNVPLLEETTRMAQVPCIVPSGFHKLSYYPEGHWLFSASTDTLAEVLQSECTLGVLLDDQHPFESERSATKANILKIGVDQAGVTPEIARIIQAVAQTSNALGVPCMVHTEPGVPFEDLAAALQQAQINPHKVVICHMGKSLDPALHARLAALGFSLEFDEMVRPAPPLPDLAAAILQLFHSGKGRAVVMGGDFARQSYWPSYGGKPGLSYLLTDLEEALIGLGFSPAMLDQIWIENPRQLFA